MSKPEFNMELPTRLKGFDRIFRSCCRPFLLHVNAEPKLRHRVQQARFIAEESVQNGRLHVCSFRDRAGCERIATSFGEQHHGCLEDALAMVTHGSD